MKRTGIQHTRRTLVGLSVPLVLSINTALATVYAGWVRQASLAGGICLGLVAIGLWLAQTMRSQDRRRLAAEHETLRSAGVLRAYFANASDALFIVNVGQDGTLRYGHINPSCEAMTSLVAEETIGKRPGEIFKPEMARSVEQRYRACLDTGETYTYAEARTFAAGKRDLLTILVPIRAADGTIRLILGNTRDMTEQTKLQSEQLHASKMEAVGRLTAGVAHDFNNDLQTIIGSLDLLSAEYLTSPDAQEIGRTAHAAASSGARLVHHLLAFSRQQVLRPRRVTVANLLQDTQRMMGRSALGAGIRFKIAVEPFTDDIEVDPTQAENCLVNLLLNARDAMPNGGSLVLHARNAHPEDGVFGVVGPGKNVIIGVHDTGHGMDEATMQQAFEPFFTTKSFGSGAGLGLSMAQGFCRQSGGDIRLMHGGKVGTRVELWLPAATGGFLAEEERDFNLATIGHGTGRVLLVEDEQDVSEALVAAMVSGGFEVVAVDNAADGLLRLQDRDPYDAVMTDHALQDLAAPGYLAQVAALVPGMPMLMLCDDDMAAPAGLPPGVRLLRKPVRRSALLNALRDTIGETRASLAA